MSLRDNAVEEALEALGDCVKSHSHDPAWAELRNDKARPILEKLLTDTQAATVERVLEWLNTRAKLSRQEGLQVEASLAEVFAQRISALSPDPDWLRRKELEARRDGIIFCRRSNWAKQDAELADLDRQLKALGTVPK